MSKKSGTKTKMSKELYDSSTDNKKENERLISQATTIEVFDTNAIIEILDAIKKSGKKPGETIYILELGGADMKGARISRYNDKVLSFIKKLGYKVKIVNAEYNETAVKTAVELYGDMFTNAQVDLNDNPKLALEKLKKLHTKGKGFDMIFSNYVLQHLQNPPEVMSAVESVLSKKGMSVHRVPDDRLKVKGFYTNGKPNKKANDAATSIVEIFLKTLTRTRTDRKLGGKMFDVCTTGYEEEKGVDFDTVYDRIATEVIPASADEQTKITYLKRDFIWYIYALKEAGEEVEDPVFSKICFDAAAECEANYEILKKEFLKKGTAYHYGEHEIIVSHGLELLSEPIKKLDKYRTLKVEIARVHKLDVKVDLI